MRQLAEIDSAVGLPPVPEDAPELLHMSAALRSAVALLRAETEAQVKKARIENVG